MLKRIVLVFMLLAAVPAAANAQGFLLGVIVGNTLSGGEQYSVSGGSVLYTASQEVLKKVDPMKVRIATSGPDNYQLSVWGTSRMGSSTLGDVFKNTVREDADRYVVLQIVRVIGPSNGYTASLWFLYIEKDLLAE
jgi:hypothetical protein